jgi:hypothetical protein
MRIEIDLPLQPKLDSLKIGSKICFIYIGFGSSFFGRTFLWNLKFQLGLDMLFWEKNSGIHFLNNEIKVGLGMGWH